MAPTLASGLFLAHGTPLSRPCDQLVWDTGGVWSYLCADVNVGGCLPCGRGLLPIHSLTFEALMTTQPPYDRDLMATHSLTVGALIGGGSIPYGRGSVSGRLATADKPPVASATAQEQWHTAALAGKSPGGPGMCLASEVDGALHYRRIGLDSTGL